MTRVHAQTEERPRLSVSPVKDFEVTGTGEHADWQQAEWVTLRRRQPEGHPYDSRFKMLYSDTGLYFLMDGTDRTLTATMTEDFMDLWNEDVFEVFLWTDERYPVLLRVRDFAAQSRAVDPGPEFRRAVPRLASLALREGSPDAQGHQHHGRTEGVARLDSGMARGVLHPVHAAEAAAERAAQAGLSLAGQLLPHGSRQRNTERSGSGRESVRASTSTRSSAICCLRIADDHERNSPEVPHVEP